MKSILFILTALSLIYGRNVKITNVYAGDSLKTSKGEIIRFLGVVCPRPHEPYGKEIHEYVKEILEGKLVALMFDDDTERRDSSGMIMSYAYLVCDTCEGASFNSHGARKNVITIQAPLIDICELLLKKGMCRVDTVHACSKRTYFNYLQRTAKKSGVGIWKTDTSEAKKK